EPGERIALGVRLAPERPRRRCAGRRRGVARGRPRCGAPVAAPAAELPCGIKVGLTLHQRSRHAGQEPVAHVADHPAARGAEQPVVRAIGGGLVEPDADTRVGGADLCDDVAHGGLLSAPRRRVATSSGIGTACRRSPGAAGLATHARTSNPLAHSAPRAEISCSMRKVFARSHATRERIVSTSPYRAGFTNREPDPTIRTPTIRYRANAS